MITENIISILEKIKNTAELISFGEQLKDPDFFFVNHDPQFVFANGIEQVTMWREEGKPTLTYYPKNAFNDAKS